MLAHPQRLVRFNATQRTFPARPTRVNLHDVTSVLLTVMVENRAEVAPANLGLVPRVLRGFEHPFHDEVFDEHGVILRGVEVREFVLDT